MPAGAFRYHLQRTEGEVEGPFDRFALRELLYTGGLSGRERVRPLGGAWSKLSERPEFQDLQRFSGREEVREGERRIQGWQRKAAEPEASPLDEAPAPLVEAPAPPAPAPAAASNRTLLLAIGALGLLVVLGALLLLLSRG